MLLGLKAVLSCWILLWPEVWRMHSAQPAHLGHFVWGQKEGLCPTWTLIPKKEPGSSSTWILNIQLMLFVDNKGCFPHFLFVWSLMEVYSEFLLWVLVQGRKKHAGGMKELFHVLPWREKQFAGVFFCFAPGRKSLEIQEGLHKARYFTQVGVSWWVFFLFEPVLRVHNVFL